MRIRRVLSTTTAALAVVAGLPGLAGAAPASTTHVAAPYTTTYTGGSTDCKAGAVCTPQATASAATGAIHPTMQLERTVADQPAKESGFAHADQVLDLRIPRGATQLTATFSWTVRSATTSARADHGVAYASTLLYGQASCAGCTTNDATASLVSSSSAVPASDNANSVTDVRKTVTLTVQGLPGKGTVRIYSGASAYTDMTPSEICVGLPGCDQLPPADANHSGVARAAVDATLTSVDVSYS